MGHTLVDKALVGQNPSGTQGTYPGRHAHKGHTLVDLPWCHVQYTTHSTRHTERRAQRGAPRTQCTV